MHATIQSLFAILGLFASASAQNCDQKYLRLSEKHTACLPKNATCKILANSVSETDKEIILDEHNKYRSNIAVGKEKVISLPVSSAMMQLVWDDELADVAQRHADQCVFEHDCSECRAVPNFSVGQNLYTDTISGGSKAPEPNWTAAVASWYNEITLFDEEWISPFIASSGEPTYGHFTQVIWGSSWRVGCGYTMHSEKEKEFTGLYVCNYGPGGNVKKGALYEKGTPCSKCPVNSCCDTNCDKVELNADYSGLCQMIYDEAPIYNSTKDNNTFSCSFTDKDKDNCDYKVTEGFGNWEVVETLSGNYLTIVLNGGEKSVVAFTKSFKGKNGICFTFYYSKGPSEAGKASKNEFVQRYISDGEPTDIPLAGGSANNVKYSMVLGWDDETTISFIFSVPKGAPKQFLTIKDLRAKTGEC